MLRHIRVTNIGPAGEIALKPGRRTTLLTGDNGLGRRLLLDSAWRTLTGRWPAEANPELRTGFAAFARPDAEQAQNRKPSSKTTTEPPTRARRDGAGAKHVDESGIGLRQVAAVARRLTPETDFTTDEHRRNVFLTDRGVDRVEHVFDRGSLYDPENLHLLIALQNALHAECLLDRDVDYGVLHKRLQRGRPLDQFRRRAALVKETSDEADRRGWCTRAGACAVSPMCGGPRSTPLRLRESQTTLDAPVERNVSRGLSSPSRLCERPCQVGDDLVQ